MPKQQPQKPLQNVPLPFPLAGIDSSDPTDRQRPMTCRDALNVRGIEALTMRARGGSRPGLSKLIDQALPVA